jgi:hypothetical protein
MPKLIPVPDALSKPFWDAVNQRRLADDPGAKFGHSMPPALLISAALAASIVLPISTSAKGHRSASVKREFQLTHPGPATGRTSGA